jgi:hypothetical protein
MLSFVCLYVQMWDLAGVRLSGLEHCSLGASEASGVEPWVGERQRCEDVEARPAGEERVARRHRFDDLGEGHRMLLR